MGAAKARQCGGEDRKGMGEAWRRKCAYGGGVGEGVGA